MSRKSSSSIGALHPLLFFVVVYGISLFLAIFVCRTVYYGINDKGSAQTEIQAPSTGLTGSVAYK
jgi:hypothetical protein